MEIHHITIIGVGLIGGSLGKSWRSSTDVSCVITGVDDAVVLDKALAAGSIDQAELDVDAGVKEADLVVLATPLFRMLHLLESIAPYLKENAVVTDVGSVKTPIVSYANEVLRDDILFVGGHPMAGSEHSGIEHADPFLFENATWAVCSNPSTESDSRLNTLVELIRVTGARLLPMSPEEHDDIAATASHLPQLVAVALTNVVGRKQEQDGKCLQLAAGGFRDLTRIAGSRFGLWRDIVAANRGPVLDALASMAFELQTLRNRLIEEDFEAIGDLFDKAGRIRNSIPKDSKGFLFPLSDVYVQADDRPGWIAGMTRIIADAGINISDMELLKVREGTGGTFRLSFGDRETARRATDVLSQNGYAAYTLD